MWGLTHSELELRLGSPPYLSCAFSCVLISTVLCDSNPIDCRVYGAKRFNHGNYNVSSKLP